MSKRQKKWLIIIVICLAMVCLGVFALNKLRGHGYLSATKNYIRYILNKPDFDEYEPLSHEENAWYEEYTLIAHAMAGIGETDYTNSLEAFESAMANGYRVFEVDFSVTADGRVVCSHEFEEYGEETPSYDVFMNNRILGEYTPIDMPQLIALLQEHEEIYLMTDFKWDNSFGSNNQDVKVIMEEMIACIEAYQEPELFDRVIIQVYSEENYAEMKSYDCFSNYVYTLYQYAYPIYDEIAAFCLENNIPVVTMGMERATRENVELFEEWNIRVFSHTVNDLDVAEQQLKNGVTGIYTDWILPTEMEQLQ